MEPTIIGHPSQRQLVAFAESLVDKRAQVSALMAAHVAACPVCAREVKQIRASLEVAAIAHLPEPSEELTRRILTRVRQARTRHAPTPTRTGALASLLQTAACMVAAIALAYLSFTTALREAASDESSVLDGMTLVADVPDDVSILPRQTAAVHALSTAIALQQDAWASPRELGYRRSLDALNRDMTAALAALERNPGCIRATQVILNSVEQQLEGLRNLYLDRTL